MDNSLINLTLLSHSSSDTVHDLTGLYSVYTNWRNIEIMFHVSTQLPYERHDPQKLQRKRHIGNDIVCVVFLEADNTAFSPACIKSHFLHTFILVRIDMASFSSLTIYLELLYEV